MGLVAPWHVESSQTRDRTHVPCIGRRIPNHWTIGEFTHELLTDTRKCLNFVFHIVLLCFIQMSQLPFSFLQILLPVISLGETKSSRITLCTVVRLQLLGCFCLFFLYGFLSWLRQNSPLSNRQRVSCWTSPSHAIVRPGIFGHLSFEE